MFRSSSAVRVRHPIVRGGVFELVRAFEFTADFEAETITYTVELWRGSTRRTVFRARIWESELFRLRPSFPQSKGRPIDISDDELRVERPIPHVGFDYDLFKARGIQHATTMITEGLERYLAHVSNQPLESKATKRTGPPNPALQRTRFARR